MDKIVWIDFENAPHVWVLKDFLNFFYAKGLKVLITARDFSYTLELCDYLNISVDRVTQTISAKNKINKFLTLIDRSKELYNFIKNLNNKPKLAISHGSRSQALASYALNIPVISLDDYEYSFKAFNYFVNEILTPFPIPKSEWGFFSNKIIQYPGLKEELYLWNKSNYNCSLNLRNDYREIIIIFRAEANNAHYYDPKSTELRKKILEFLTNFKNIHLFLFARDKKQENEIVNFLIQNKVNFTIPHTILNGPALLYNSDLVIGGGGTMTREAAVLGIPSYSFFQGKLPHVDKYLIDTNKLVHIKDIDDIKKIKVEYKTARKTEIPDEAFTFVSRYLLNKL